MAAVCCVSRLRALALPAAPPEPRARISASWEWAPNNSSPLVFRDALASQVCRGVSPSYASFASAEGGSRRTVRPMALFHFPPTTSSSMERKSDNSALRQPPASVTTHRVQRATCARRATHARSARKAHHASSGRARCCGDGFLLLRFPDAGVPRAAARDPRGARAVCDVRAHVERRRELRVGGVVRLLRLARRACCCRLVLFAFSTRPDGGKTTIRLPTADQRPPKADERLPKADETPTQGRRNAHPKGPGAEIAPIAPQCRPVCTPSLRATLSRRPLAPPVCNG